MTSRSSLRALLILGSLCAAAALSACQTTPDTTAKRENLTDDAQAAVNRFQREAPNLKDFLAKSHGYAIFPDVGKGGLVVGGAYGRGRVYEMGRPIGYADLRQATVGAQIGGQTYSELIVFENAEALNNFRSNKLAFSANASAVAIKAGTAATAKYENGVAVFTMPKGGLMAEASVGGQQFTYVPSDQAEGRMTTPSTMP
jgi:lipid-binding SYLF domain-containing protein